MGNNQNINITVILDLCDLTPIYREFVQPVMALQKVIPIIFLLLWRLNFIKTSLSCFIFSYCFQIRISNGTSNTMDEITTYLLFFYFFCFLPVEDELWMHEWRKKYNPSTVLSLKDINITEIEFAVSWQLRWRKNITNKFLS